MKKICSFICSLLIITTIFTGCGKFASGSNEANNLKNFGTSQKVVIIVLDGFTSSYFNYLGKDSSLYKLLNGSTYNLDSQSIFPSHTCPAHTSIMTGCYPAKHGIIGNVYYNSETSTSEKNISPDRIKVDTLFQIAKKNGKSTAFVSGKPNLINMFQKDCDIKVCPSEYPEYLDKAPALEDSENNDEYYKYNIDTTKWLFNSLEKVLQQKKPDVVLVNIQSSDFIGHRFGPGSDEEKQIVSLIDNCIGDFNKFMKENKILDNTAVVITADHGMSPDSKSIPFNVLMSNNFSKAGGVVDGRNAYITLNGEDQNKVVSFFEKQEGIDKIILKNSDEAKAFNINCDACPDIILNSKPDYIFIPEAMLYKYKGQHGSLDKLDMTIPIIWFGSGVPKNKNIADSNLVNIMPTVCKLLNIQTGNIDGKVSDINDSTTINYFKK